MQSPLISLFQWDGVKSWFVPVNCTQWQLFTGHARWCHWSTLSGYLSSSKDVIRVQKECCLCHLSASVCCYHAAAAAVYCPRPQKHWAMSLHPSLAMQGTGQTLQIELQTMAPTESNRIPTYQILSQKDHAKHTQSTWASSRLLGLCTWLSQMEQW